MFIVYLTHFINNLHVIVLLSDIYIFMLQFKIYTIIYVFL